MKASNNMLRLHMNEPHTNFYPDQEPLAVELAKHLGVPRENLLLVAGAAQGLEVAIRSHAGTVITPDPCFPLVPKHSVNNGKNLVRVPLTSGQDFPLDNILSACRNAQSPQLIVSTVENPTGVLFPAACVDILKNSIPGIELVVDEVYSRFLPMGSPSLYAKAAAETKGLVVVTSFSKWGHPQLRIGVVIAHRDRLEKMKTYVSALAIGSPSLNIALRALANTTVMEAGITRQIRARDFLVESLKNRGIACVPSPANWVLIETKDAVSCAAFLSSKHKILVQVPEHPSLHRFIRVSTPTKAAMRVFLNAIDDFQAATD